MSGHLCLKWNNHSASFLKNIRNVQSKEKYCDATITCQGKYFSVHRIVLSTCSDYFEEMFERIQNQHPYIVFKDIDPREMELLLNYMYQGEVNVLQENLPTFIKAAEALRIKGLAVPDDLPTPKEQTPSKKRSNTFNDNSQVKRRADERRRRRNSSETQSHINEKDTFAENPTEIDIENESKSIKEEPLDTGYDEGGFSSTVSNINEGQPSRSNEHEFVKFSESENAVYIKNEENLTQDEPYDEQSSTWAEYDNEDPAGNAPAAELNLQEDIFDASQSHSNAEMDESARLNVVDESRTSAASSNSRSISLGLPIGRCHICRFRTYSTRLLEYHMLSKHSEERPYACTICHVRCKLKQNLVIHMRIHTGERPFKCPHCGSKFRHSNSLKRHLNRKVQCNKQILSMNQQNP